MRRKYKLLLIIVISIILAYFIYIFNSENKIYLVSLGDGVASGETAYNIDGISYNDYLKEYFESTNNLKKYNNNFSKKNYQVKDLVQDIENNLFDEKNELYFKQILHKGDIITISIGEDELTKLSMTKDLTEEYLKDYIKNYDKLLSILKDLTKGKILIIGLYENDYLEKSKVIIINSEIANLAKKYDLIFVDISDLMLNKDYYLNKFSYYFNYKGHETISEIIIHSL